MEEITIPHTYVKVLNSAPFRSDGGTGPMREGIDYCIKLKDGTYWKETTRSATDKNTLLQLIQEGKIWVLKQHIERECRSDDSQTGQ